MLAGSKGDDRKTNHGVISGQEEQEGKERQQTIKGRKR